MARTSGARLVVVRNDLPKLPPALRAAVADEIARSAFQVEAVAKAKAPVRTGTLRRSIHTVLSDGGLTARVGPSVAYGFFVEFGTRFMSARPYMRPAAALVFPRCLDRVRAILRRGPPP